MKAALGRLLELRRVEWQATRTNDVSITQTIKISKNLWEAMRDSRSGKPLAL